MVNFQDICLMSAHVLPSSQEVGVSRGCYWRVNWSLALLQSRQWIGLGPLKSVLDMDPRNIYTYMSLTDKDLHAWNIFSIEIRLILLWSSESMRNLTELMNTIPIPPLTGIDIHFHYLWEDFSQYTKWYRNILPRIEMEMILKPIRLGQIGKSEKNFPMYGCKSALLSPQHH